MSGFLLDTNCISEVNRPQADAGVVRWFSEADERQLSVSTTDGLLAATALEHDLTVVTRNVKDYSGLGVRLLNPWDSGH